MCASDAFVAQGGLSCAASLRNLTLDARLAYIPSIVQQLTSPHLTDSKLKINLSSFANRHALGKDEVRDELVQSLTESSPPSVLASRLSYCLRGTGYLHRKHLSSAKRVICFWRPFKLYPCKARVGSVLCAVLWIRRRTRSSWTNSSYTLRAQVRLFSLCISLYIDSVLEYLVIHWMASFCLNRHFLSTR